MIWAIDRLIHRLGLRFRWICDLLDIECGMGFSDLHLNGGGLPRTRLNRLAMWWFNR